MSTEQCSSAAIRAESPGNTACRCWWSDADWDLLGDRLRQLVRELEDQDLARVLLALRGTLIAGSRAIAEARSARPG